MKFTLLFILISCKDQRKFWFSRYAFVQSEHTLNTSRVILYKRNQWYMKTKKGHPEGKVNENKGEINAKSYTDKAAGVFLEPVFVIWRKEGKGEILWSRNFSQL